MNSPLPNSSAKTSAKAKNKGSFGRIMRTAFHPEFGQSMAPLREKNYWLQHMLAFIFAQHGLFDRHHPALVAGAPLSFQEIFSTGWSRLEFTRDGLPKIFVFFCFTGALVFSLLALIVAMLMALVGTAHAADGTDMFQPISQQNDFALKFLDHIFFGKDLTIALQNNTVPTIVKGGIVHNALSAMLGFYSKAALVLASFLLFYHLVMLTVETAQTGTILGNKDRQFWAPIRLVFAIGLLVPISGSGMNSGQYIVLQVAKWGSGLASQTWRFYNTGLNNKSVNFIRPEVGNVSGLITSATLINMCREGIEMQLEDIDRVSSNSVIKGSFAMASRVIREIAVLRSITPDGTYTFSFGNKDGKTICGSLKIKPPKGITFDLETGTSGLPKNLAEDIEVAKLESLSWLFQATKPYAREMMRTQMNIGTAGALPDPEQLRIIARQYYDRLNRAIETAAERRKVPATLDNRGWIVAGSYFMDLAKEQGEVYNAANPAEITLPNVTDPIYTIDDKNYAEIGKIVFLANDQWINTPQVSKITERISATDSKIQPEKVNADSKVLDTLNAAAKQAGLWDNSGLLGKFIGSTTGLGKQFDPNNAITSLSALGWAKFRLSLYILGVGAAAPMIAAPLANGANWLGSKVPLIGGVLGPLAGGIIQQAGSLITTFSIFVFVAAISASILLAFVLPMMPFIKFLFGVIAWFKSIAEAIVGVPLWALAHISTDGNGLPGKHGEQGYYVLLHIFLRPVLMLFGLILALILVNVAISFLNLTYNYAVSGALGETITDANILIKFVYSIMYAVIAYSIANTCFKMIDILPQNSMMMIGKSAADRQDQDQNINVMASAFGTAGAQIGLTSAAQGFNSSRESIAGKNAEATSKAKAKKDAKDAATLEEKRHKEQVQALRDLREKP
jgi:conjugal transfer/type IV secretion protein DotA/TraY